MFAYVLLLIFGTLGFRPGLASGPANDRPKYGYDGMGGAGGIKDSRPIRYTYDGSGLGGVKVSRPD